MISFEALLLFIIMLCVVFLTACMVIGIVFLVRYYTTFKKLEEQVENLGRNINANVVPVAQEFSNTAVTLRELINTAQDSVADYATLSMMRKISPKLAGLKLGMDLGLKAYNSYLSTSEKNTKGQNFWDIFRKLSK